MGGVIHLEKKEAEPIWKLVNACLEEALDKQNIDILNDDYLNHDHHIEVTVTVKEIRSAATALGMKAAGKDEIDK